MKVEFLDDISAGGKFTDIVADQLVRLYDFDNFQVEMLRHKIQQGVIENGNQLNLSELAFVEVINCELTLRLAETDIGIVEIDNGNFVCDLTISGYENMVSLLEPFCMRVNEGYQWLYDIDTPIEFLFSVDGSW